MSTEHDPGVTAAFLEKVASNIRPLLDDKGEIVGRACIAVESSPFWDNIGGVAGAVTVGGLRACGLSGIVGILPGRPLRASRDHAVPLLTNTALAEWANEQAKLVPRLSNDPVLLSLCAQYIRICGGKYQNLPLAKYRGTWVSAEEIAKLVDLPETIYLVERFQINETLKCFDLHEVENSIFVTEVNGFPAIVRSPHSRLDGMWPITLGETDGWEGSYASLTIGGMVAEAICRSWGVAVEKTLEQFQKDREDEVVIARAGDRLIKGRALRITKPA